MSYYNKFLKVVRILKEKQTGLLTTNHTRPLFSKDYTIQSDTQKKETSLAIVMQGQLILKNNFTLETICIYKKVFPKNTKIILSTWVGEDEKTISTLKSLGIIVITNPKPIKGGIGNINYQVVSTMEGIREAKKYNVEYILKTRTDIRMYAPNIAPYLESICTLFPISKEYAQEKRIVAFSINTYKYRPYSISDLTLFGTVRDIENYFTVDEDTRTTARFNSIREWSEERFCEVYLSTHFLEKVGRTLSYTLEDSWKMYAEHFCVLDASSVDLVWYKYHYFEEYRDLVYKYMKNNQELTFREWLILYSSQSNKKYIPEEILDETFGTKIGTKNI